MRTAGHCSKKYWQNTAELCRELPFLSGHRDIFSSNFGMNVTHSALSVNIRNLI